MLEQCFLTLDKQIHEHMGFYEDEEMDYSSDEDMLQTVLGHKIFRYAPSDLADILGESIAQDFEYLAIGSDRIVFDPNSLDKENCAPTPPYISPQSVEVELGHSDPEAEAEAVHLLAEEIEIMVEWATKGSKFQKSNGRLL